MWSVANTDSQSHGGIRAEQTRVYNPVGVLKERLGIRPECSMQGAT